MNRILFIAIIITSLSMPAVSFAYSDGSGEPNDPYQIATKADLLELAGTAEDYNKCFVLTADIYMENEVFTTPIIVAGIFTGDFDGDGYTITHFTINNGCGFFGDIGSGGSIKNLGLKNCAVTVNSGMSAAGLACTNDGTITNCYSTADVSFTGSPFALHAGGLVAANLSGTIANCYSTGTVSVSILSGFGQPINVGGLVGYNYDGTISSSYSTGSVSISGSSGNYRYGGGLVGYNSTGIIVNCYATGEVDDYEYVGGLVGRDYSGSITNCYSTGAVSGTDYVGGLIGSKPGGSLISSYFLTGAGPDNGYGTPLTDTQMKQQASFIDWDFVAETTNGSDDIWRMCVDGIDYPLLWLQFNPADFTCPDSVDFVDFAVLADAWLSDPLQDNWNPRCDIAGFPHGIIDVPDLEIFVQNWLQQE